MQRGSVIATVVAAGGVLIAGSVASVAVINAASSSPAQSQTVELVAADQPAAVTEQAPAGPEQAPPVPAPTDLPALPAVGSAPAESAPAETAPAENTPSAKPSARPSAQRVAAVAKATRISADKARTLVMKKGDGTSTVSVSKSNRQGYRTWAVTITRANGEVLTGYVDQASGVIVDWKVVRKATASSSSGSSSDARESDDDSQDVQSSDDSKQGDDDSASHDSASHDSNDDHGSDGDDHDDD